MIQSCRMNGQNQESKRDKVWCPLVAKYVFARMHVGVYVCLSLSNENWLISELWLHRHVNTQLLFDYTADIHSYLLYQTCKYTAPVRLYSRRSQLLAVPDM
jgi:hypothetical protein